MSLSWQSEWAIHILLRLDSEEWANYFFSYIHITHKTLLAFDFKSKAISIQTDMPLLISDIPASIHRVSLLFFLPFSNSFLNSFNELTSSAYVSSAHITYHEDQIFSNFFLWNNPPQNGSPTCILGNELVHSSFGSSYSSFPHSSVNSIDLHAVLFKMLKINGLLGLLTTGNTSSIFQPYFRKFTFFLNCFRTYTTNNFVPSCGDSIHFAMNSKEFSTENPIDIPISANSLTCHLATLSVGCPTLDAN